MALEVDILGMSSRPIKRILILFVFLSIAGGSFFLYWQTRDVVEPTCFDNVKNQDETGVDCGGTCASCQGKPESLQIDPAILIPAENNRFDVAFKITNPNTNFGASTVDYSVEIFASDGTKLSSRIDTTFILPTGLRTNSASQKWVIEHGLKGEQNAKVIVNLKNITWEAIKDNFEAPRLVILDRVYTVLVNSPELAEAKGVLKNDSPYNFDMIEIQVLLFGEDDKLLAVRRTETRTLRADERREFRVSWRTPISKVNRVEMSAYTNVFLNENFINNYGTREKFQEINPVIR